MALKNELKTERLRLRQLKDEDYELFFTMSENPLVSEYLPPFPDKEASDCFLDYLRENFEARGWGFWAIERKDDKKFMGIVGLHKPGPEFGVRPCIEIGWRLAPEFWGKGYVTEAAREVLRFGFIEIGLHEIVSFTALGNTRSIAVMERIGMQREPENFELQILPEGHPHRVHCLYSLSREKWIALQN